MRALVLVVFLTGCGAGAQMNPTTPAGKCAAYRTITSAACEVIEQAPCPFERSENGED